ncbi:hypothetical protein EYF80_055049 [Liparis tanakae]|uniref:Uncharacterized protein n=1 Tax=Liparis tanakae TaxID=230148 RepID=A0A4Z2F0X3_9TELE|nr:hypothetical protein EYF80_055049 [Liparis tanakae]
MKTSVPQRKTPLFSRLRKVDYEADALRGEEQLAPAGRRLIGGRRVSFGAMRAAGFSSWAAAALTLCCLDRYQYVLTWVVWVGGGGTRLYKGADYARPNCNAP